MHKHWSLAAIMVIAAVTITACGGGDSEGNGGADAPEDNPGGLTSDQVGARVSEILTTSGCDVPARYSRTSTDGDTWVLRGSMGVTTFTWTFDPANDSVVEREGRCKRPAPTAVPIRDPEDARFFSSDQVKDRVNELLTAQGCDVPETFKLVNLVGGIWTLRADIGSVSYLWSYDPETNTLVEFAGLCEAM